MSEALAIQQLKIPVLAKRRSETIVPADIYFGCTRMERKKIARELANVRLIRSQAIEALTTLTERFRSRTNALLTLSQELNVPVPDATLDALQKQFQLESAPFRNIAYAPTPTRLLACHDCGRVTSECTCADAEGKPLVWNA